MRASILFVVVICSCFFTSCSTYQIKNSVTDIHLLEICKLQKESEIKVLKENEQSQENSIKIEGLQKEISVLDEQICIQTTKLFGGDCSKACGGTGCCKEINKTNKFFCDIVASERGIVDNGGGCNAGGGCEFPDFLKTGWYTNLTRSFENVKFFNKNGDELKILQTKTHEKSNSELIKFENLKIGGTFHIEFSLRNSNNELQEFRINDLNFSR